MSHICFCNVSLSSFSRCLQRRSPSALRRDVESKRLKLCSQLRPEYGYFPPSVPLAHASLMARATLGEPSIHFLLNFAFFLRLPTASDSTPSLVTSHSVQSQDLPFSVSLSSTLS
ncbi:hypothetical protein VTN31DRAFT_6859 [Thermomyces dupontii]|uniref:uncharacterized protein n=1 Tax=Talaromyces thermophilus TaxID=28565 RepID=UPI00374246FA